MEAILSTLISNAPNCVGFVLPVVVEVINKDIQSDKERYLLSLLICFVVAVLLDWHQIAYGTPDQVLATAALLFTESNATFKLYFSTSWVREKIQQKIKSQQVVVPEVSNTQ